MKYKQLIQLYIYIHIEDHSYILINYFKMTTNDIYSGQCNYNVLYSINSK